LSCILFRPNTRKGSVILLIDNVFFPQSLISKGEFFTLSTFIISVKKFLLIIDRTMVVAFRLLVAKTVIVILFKYCVLVVVLLNSLYYHTHFGVCLDICV